MRRISAVVVAAALLAVGTTTGAVAGSYVSSRHIVNNTVRSVDVRDGTLRPRDLRPALADRIFWTNALAAENEGRLDYVDEELERLYVLRWQVKRQADALAERVADLEERCVTRGPHE